MPVHVRINVYFIYMQHYELNECMQRGICMCTCQVINTIISNHCMDNSWPLNSHSQIHKPGGVRRIFMNYMYQMISMQMISMGGGGGGGGGGGNREGEGEGRLAPRP